MDKYSKYVTPSLISPKQAYKWAENTKDYCIIDMRDLNQYRMYHVPNALSLLPHEIETKTRIY